MRFDERFLDEIKSRLPRQEAKTTTMLTARDEDTVEIHRIHARERVTIWLIATIGSLVGTTIVSAVVFLK